MILGTEWIFLVIAVLILLFGAKKVPEMARAFGRAIGEFQKGRAEIERELRAATQELQQPIVETAQTFQSAFTPQPPQLPQTTEVSQPPQPSPQPLSEREKLEKAARDLGIEVEGKSDEELKEEIKKALE